MAGGRRRHKHSKRKRLKHLDDRDAALEDLCYLERGRAASEVSDSKRPPSSISLTHSQDTSTVEGGTESVAPDDLVSLLRVNRLLKEQNALLTQRQLLLDASRSVPGGPEDDSLHSSITNPISFVSAIQLDVESQGRTKESLAVCQTTDPSNRLFERTAPTVGIPEPKVAPSSPEPGKQE